MMNISVVQKMHLFLTVTSNLSINQNDVGDLTDYRADSPICVLEDKER